MDEFDTDKIKKAGEIAAEAVAYARDLIKPGMKLLEIAEKIDFKILELGGKPAFPVNLSINEIAAHSTPTWNDETVASGLLKIDIGVHLEGWIADTAFSLDLEESDENKRLITAAESALKKALDLAGKGVGLSETGKAIGNEIESHGFSPVANLSGHSINRYDLHSGINVPNVENFSLGTFEDGLYAIEPFSTNGLGRIKDGKPSGIYQIQAEGNVRDSFAREVLSFIDEEYKGLPFCSRWVHKRFGSRGLLALRQIKQAGLLHEHPQLIEVNNGKVAQAEHTVFINENSKVITTQF